MRNLAIGAAWFGTLVSAVDVVSASALDNPPPGIMGEVTTPPLPVPRPHFPGDRPLFGPDKPMQDAAPAMPAPVPPSPPPVTLAADEDCLAQLKTSGVGFEVTVIATQANPLCTTAVPVRILGLPGSDGASLIELPDRPTLSCATAVVFANFVQALLSPLARGTYGASVRSIATGHGFECRTRDHIAGAKISAHAQGLAIDIAQIMLTDGRKIEVGAAKTGQDQMFDKAARAGACGFFHTALGPGADQFHETHWHFDLEPRGSKGDGRVCQ